MTDSYIQEPELVRLIKRLAELEAIPGPEISGPELSELNALRMDLDARWPAVGLALAQAYVTAPSEAGNDRQ